MSIGYTPYQVWFVVMVLAVIVISPGIHGAMADAQDNMPDTRTVALLVPETGIARAGLAEQVIGAIDFALVEFNEYLRDMDAGWQLAIEKYDTKSDPAESLRLVQELDNMGISAIIGPATSSSVREIKDYVDANGMVVISYSSGASDLAVSGDRIFRTIADTKSYAAANYRLWQDDGIREVVTIVLDDSIGRSVNQTAYDVIDSSEDITMRGSIRVSPYISDVSVVATELRTILSADPPINDYSKVGIMIFDYTENIVDIVYDVATASIPDMTETRWYGPDHMIKRFAANYTIISFLEDTNFKAFATAYGENSLNMRIDTIVNEVNSYAYGAYDALFIMGNAINMASSATDGDAIAAAIPIAATMGHGPDQHIHTNMPLYNDTNPLHQYSGALGASVALNEAGDLAASDYHIYSVVDGAFIITDRYNPVTDSIQEFVSPEKRKVGVLVSETGTLAEDIGIAASEAISLAAYNYNLGLARDGADWRLEIIKKEDGATPSVALENTMAFHADGISAMIGPLTSGSVSNMLDFVNQNEMVAISYASSSPTLAVPDNMFRMRASDEHTSRAYASLLEYDGITDLVIIYRNDTWGVALNEGVIERLTQMGNIDIRPSITYDPADPTVDYHTVIETVKSRLAGAEEACTAVMLFGFGEIWDIVDIARVDPHLQAERFYAFLSSSNVKPPPDRAQWMEDVKYTGVVTFPIANKISKHIDANVPGANFYSYHAYDALYTMAEAIRDAGTAYDGAKIADAIPEAAASLWPNAIGFPIQLDESGDIAKVDYGVYDLRDGIFKLRAFYSYDIDHTYALPNPAYQCR